MSRTRQSGFTTVELMISVLIVGVLAAIAVPQIRDYTRRASLSELVMAVNQCKNVVSENYLLLEHAPEPGTWGCEDSGGGSRYSGPIETSSDGVIRVAIRGLDRLVDGRYVYLVPARFDGVTPLTAPNDFGRNVGGWICGSDWLPVRNSLPANCRSDTTTFASQDFSN